MTGMEAAMIRELEIRKGYLSGEELKTIYFGGGTPSLLPTHSLQNILNTITSHFNVNPQVEVTLEANPDDLSQRKLDELLSIGINRLSIGVQSFRDDYLSYMNRSHSATEAISCIRQAQKSGFDNLTADLIYAIPGQTLDDWNADLEQMVELNIPHISLYGLTIEDQTVFGNWFKKGKLKETPEENAARQYEYAIEYLSGVGIAQYEVSNFARPGFESKHNGAYWAGDKYLGVGPGAHSFNGKSRSFNIRNNAKYIQALSEGVIPETLEELSITQRVNETILTSLRTTKGLNLNKLKEEWQVDLQNDQKEELSNLQKGKLAKISDNYLTLTTSGFMVADDIALRLFYDE